MPTILAIDFETANHSLASACQLAAVRIEDWRITASQSWLIRPPTEDFVFTYLHGIDWEKVKGEPDWGGLWPILKPQFQGIDYLAAHNASFDEGVLKASCEAYGLRPPKFRYLDTVGIARKVWNIFPTKLNLVCEKLGIPLNHHEALSDANACAEILVRAKAAGWAGPSTGHL